MLSRSHLSPGSWSQILRAATAILSSLLILIAIGKVEAQSAAPVETAAVMAPLFVSPQDRDNFDSLLADAKAAGANTVTVDVWWGLVESDGDRSTLRIFPGDPAVPVADRVIASVGRHGVDIASVFVEQGRLDDVFRSITTGK